MAGETSFTVFHDGGYHESTFEIDTVWAASAMRAVQQVHERAHKGTNASYTYFVAKTEDLLKINAVAPTTTQFSGEKLERANAKKRKI